MTAPTTSRRGAASEPIRPTLVRRAARTVWCCTARNSAAASPTATPDSVRPSSVPSAASQMNTVRPGASAPRLASPEKASRSESWAIAQTAITESRIAPDDAATGTVS